MEYGYFDSQNREYVITNPATPAPWANYLGSPEYGAIISNNAGGYSFVKSGAAGRILRYRFNSDDTPGRYIYIRDSAAGDYWSASWQPVGKSLDEYKNICRHGTGYSVFETEYKGIKSTVSYYVPVGKTHEVWAVVVKNVSNKPRDLSVFGFAEFTNEGNYEQDGVNLQYTQYISATSFRDNTIFQAVNENLKRREKRFLSLAGAEVVSYCGAKKDFLGAYRSFGNPSAVENGVCTNTVNYGGNSCGALQTGFALAPGESKRFVFILGEKPEPEALAEAGRYAAAETLPDREIKELREYFAAKLDCLKVHTPSAAFDDMINTWNAYQCFITFTWSRAASFFYCGLRNGYGYRDTVQDIQGVIHLDPAAAKEKLAFMLSAQMSHGGALPLVKFDHRAGHETGPEDEEYVRQTAHPSYRADDALWLFPTVFKYIAETGDLEFLDQPVLYADKGEATVLEHLRKALDFSERHTGVHGLPAGLYADWNDCLRLGERGVSAFVAFQLHHAYEIMRQFAEFRGETEAAAGMRDKKKALADLIEKLCWNGDRYIRGISEEGEVVGAQENLEGSLWLNPQSWAVIGGAASKERGEAVLDLVHEKLNTAYGACILAPSFSERPFKGYSAISFNRGMKENAGIFLQPQGWIILAEALLGRGGRAFEYYTESCPAAQNAIAELRTVEPYVYSQFTEGAESPNCGRSHVHWLTGTASTVMVGAVEGILGLRPDLQGLRISPAVPADWKEFTIIKTWRGKRLNISVRNPGGKESGFSSLALNGAETRSNLLRYEDLRETNEIILTI
ncbi:MAG: N,N'-diacetylchitobiose phosphorylase [Oscillospiraceae bacterium]|nr:N,N'-diacetylchitobiose phosphorylase [Oscillospiraceae bacterium]